MRESGSERRVEGAHRPAGLGLGTGHDHVQTGMAGTQPQQLGPGEARGPDNPDPYRHSARLYVYPNKHANWFPDGNDTAGNRGYCYFSLTLIVFHSMIDPDVVTVLRAVPRFAERYLDLVEEADGDPSTPVAFAELAAFAAALAGNIEADRLVLGDLLEAVEAVATSSPEAEAHVGWAFLDSLAPEETERLAPWLGPNTRALGDLVEAGPDDVDSG